MSCLSTEMQRWLLNDSWFKSVDDCEETTSTNDLGMAVAKEHDSDQLPRFIIAAQQTRGRGRGDHRWWSNTGALMFSIVADVRESSADPTTAMSLRVGFAVCRALEPIVRKHVVHRDSVDGDSVDGNAVDMILPKLKWPNDVMMDRRKIAGILLEASQVPQSRVVIGCGINVNVDMSEAPPTLRENASSIAETVGHDIDSQSVLRGVLDEIGKVVIDDAACLPPLSEEWSSMGFLTGETVISEQGSRRILGRIAGVDHRGGLILRTESGIETVYSGSLRAVD